MVGGDRVAADHVRIRMYCVTHWILIFSAISIASSTLMPTYRTECPIFQMPQ